MTLRAYIRYAGRSVFYYEELPAMQDRYRDYARLLSSVGMNSIVWDNVNACGADNGQMLAHDVLTSMTPLVELFFQYGIRSFVTPCYSSPISVGNLTTADPYDGKVAAWWKSTAEFIARSWPTSSFGGFLVKADCEGEPGPSTYKRTELEGANAMATALSSVGAVVIWRAFAHPPAGEDQALYQFDLFKDWNGKTADNVVLQVKNGPYDFQVREPVHSLFGHLDSVNLIIEFEATQEYLGQARHVSHLPSQWSTYLNFDTWTRGMPNSTVAEVVTGKLKANLTSPRFTGIAAVSNLGDDSSWTAHPFSAANTYGYGRLAWNPALSVQDITREWIEATFGLNKTVADSVEGILLTSWDAYENYTASLGWGFVCAGDHYNMAPQNRQGYINASKTRIGYNRGTAAGFGGTYNPPNSENFLDVDKCPEELLLSFHNVPYTHVLKAPKYGGMTVLDWITSSHTSGAASAQRYVTAWSSIAVGADCSSTGSTEGCAAITRLLQTGATDAARFAHTVSSFVTAMAGGSPIPPPPSPPPSPSPSPSPGPSPPGFDKHADTYCSVGDDHKARIFENATMGLAACAAGCSKSAECTEYKFFLTFLLLFPLSRCIDV